MARMKVCNTCRQAKPLKDFHNDSRSKDGHVNSCKPCACARARNNRDDNLEYRRAYDRERARTPKRKDQDREALRKKRARNPARAKAHWAVANALRNGRMQKQPCEVCGEKEVDGHHDDYSKPLDVRWLCRTHHCEHHAQEMRASIT